MMSRFTLAPLAASLLVAPLAAQIALRDALPENTILYVGAPDIDRSMAEMKDMPLMRMWREEEVQDFFADGMILLEEKWNEALSQGKQAHEQGQFPFDPEELLKLRVHGLGFALTTLDIRPGAEEGDEPVPHIGVIAQLDFGESATTWRKVIEFGLGALEQQSRGKLAREQTMVGDATLITMVPPETEMSLNIAFIGSSLVFGTDRGEVTNVLGNLASGNKVLSGSKNFIETFTHLDSDGAELESYVQPGPVLDFVMKVLHVASEEAPEFPPELNVEGIGRAIEALGLRSIIATGGTSSYQQHGDGTVAVNKSFTYAPAPTRKGLFAGGNKELDMSFLKWVPKDSASFSAYTLDVASIYDGLIAALTAYDKDLSEKLMGMLAQHEEQLGISLRADLIGSLGHEFISWSMPVAAFGTMPEMAMLFGVKDQDKLLKTLETLTQISDGLVEIDKSERRGITVYTLQINYDPTGGGGMGMNPLDMFVPTFSFKDGYLVAGFSTGDVKRVFKRMDREDDPAGDIRSNAEFKPFMASLPESGLSSVSFSDWKANFEGLYQMVTSMAAFIPVDDEIPIDLSLLPDVATLTQHLYGSVAWSRADGNGYHMLSQGPWGPETIALLCGSVSAGMGAWMAQGGYKHFR